MLPGMDHNKWSAMNDVEDDANGQMPWAVFAYGSDGGVYHITDYTLRNEEAWALVHMHNKAEGYE